MPLPGVKSIIKYCQNDEPTDQIQGDIWYRPTLKYTVMWNGSEWISVRGSYGSGVDHGYCLGGTNNPSYENISSVQRFSFSFDNGNASVISNMTSSGFSYAAGGCNSSEYGYSHNPKYNGAACTSTLDKLTFASDSSDCVLAGNLSFTCYGITSMNSSKYGYFWGGHNGSSYTSTVGKIQFPHDSGTGSTVGNITHNQYRGMGLNCSNYGFMIGGDTEAALGSSAIHRVLFPFNSGTASVVGNLTLIDSGGRCSAGSCNSSIHGYILGGHANTSSMNSNIQRLTFPFDSGTSSTVGNLSMTTFEGPGCNSTTHGYSYGGGYIVNGPYSTIERIAFPHDSGTAINIGNLAKSTRSSAGIDGVDFVTQFI